MSYLDHDGLAYFKSKLDRTFIADIVFDDGDILLYGGDGTLLKTVVQEGTVTQKKSTTNKEYPILLCWDADAEEDQTMKTVWYGLDARINPKFGYLYARRYYTEHPSYERTSVPSVRAEWHHMFTDAVSAPMGEVYEYLDRNSDGGEHRMELRLYGNPLSQYVDTPNHNEATDAVSIGVGATRGDKLTFFGYCPSTPIYLEDEETFRKSLVRGDQYGKDIITRDWLNLNGSITGLVHTYMDETIDGYKTFLKTVTIDSGNDNAKAGLNVQGDVNIDSGDNTKPSNLYVQGNSHIHGNEDIDGNLNVDGTSDQHGNVHMYNNLDVDGNANTDGNQTIGGTLTVTGKITGNGGAEISGGSGLKINGNETVTGNLTVGGTTTTEDLSVTDDATIGDDLNVNGDENIKGKIYYVDNSNNKTEYVQQIVSQPEDRKKVAQGLADTSRGIGYDASSGKLYVKLASGGGVKYNNGALAIDFQQMKNENEAEFNKMIAGFIDAQYISTSGGKNQFYVDGTNGSDSNPETRGAPNAPFKTIQACVNYITKIYNFHTANAYINCKNINITDRLVLPNFNRTTGSITIRASAFTSNTDRDNPPTTEDRLIKINYTATNYNRVSVSLTGTGKWYLKNFDVSVTDDSLTSGGGHVAALSLNESVICDIRNSKFTFNRANASNYDLTAGEHVVQINNYATLELGPKVQIHGGDLSSGTRVINGFSVGDSGYLHIGDTRTVDNDDRRLVFTGNFKVLIRVTATVGRNRVYMGTTNTSGVNYTEYRFYISSGGKVSVTDSGVIDATHNEENATDTWLGTISGSKSYVQTKTYSWYD